MKHNMKSQLQRFKDHKCVVIDGVLRNKATYERYRITKRMMFDIVSQGYAEIRPGGIVLTAKGHEALRKPRSKAKTQADYYRQRRDAGYKCRMVWVHEDDEDAFNEAIKDFK